MNNSLYCIRYILHSNTKYYIVGSKKTVGAKSLKTTQLVIHEHVVQIYSLNR